MPIATATRTSDLFGCGLRTPSPIRRRRANFDIRLNITTPYMPITSDGKEPNLEPFLDAIAEAISKAVEQGAAGGAAAKARVAEGRRARQSR